MSKSHSRTNVSYTHRSPSLNFVKRAQKSEASRQFSVQALKVCNYFNQGYLLVKTLQERELGWNITPVSPLKSQDIAESVALCPKAQIRTFNRQSRLRAKELQEKALTSSNWVNKTLQARYESVPVISSTNLVQSSANIADNAVHDIEILQKIVIRENLLAELRSLVMNQSDLSLSLGEIIELVNAIRFQTVDIVESVALWQAAMAKDTSALNTKPFLYRGFNYLLKIRDDLTFLDQYDDVVEKFCFEFESNPLAYRGGGGILNKATASDDFTNWKLYESYLTNAGEDDRAFVNGIEVARLRNAEKIIQKEVARIVEEKATMKSTTSRAHDLPSSTMDDTLLEKKSTAEITEDSNELHEGTNRTKSATIGHFNVYKYVYTHLVDLSL